MDLQSAAKSKARKVKYMQGMQQRHEQLRRQSRTLQVMAQLLDHDIDAAGMVAIAVLLWVTAYPKYTTHPC